MFFDSSKRDSLKELWKNLFVRAYVAISMRDLSVCCIMHLDARRYSASGYKPNELL